MWKSNSVLPMGGRRAFLIRRDEAEVRPGTQRWIGDVGPGRRIDPAADGDLDITATVEIGGSGLGSTVIDANHIDRVFDIATNAIAIIHDMTIQNGTAQLDPRTSHLHGGGIHNHGYLNLFRASVVQNEVLTSGWGGGRGSFRALGLGVGRLSSAIGVAAAATWVASSAVVGAAGAGALVCVGGAAVVVTASAVAAAGRSEEGRVGKDG